MRKLTLSAVIASALLVVSNIASAAIVNTSEGGFSYKNVEKSPSIIVTVDRADDAQGWQYGIYYTKLDGTEYMSSNLKEGTTRITLPKGLKDVGVWAVNGGGNLTAPGVAKHIVYSFVNNETDPGFNFSMTEVGSNTFVFGKDSDGVKGTVTVSGAPLPTPVVTLLIALGLGAAFVLYRSRKQQAEA